MKYEYKQHQNTPNGSENIILTWIANELAEANRLTRLRMQRKYEEIVVTTSDLEDQA